MPSVKRVSPSLRYLRARLQPLTQPLLWGPVLVVFLGMFALWQLSINPEWLMTDDDEQVVSENSRNQEVEAISAEDSGIAADIDTSPVLVEELKRSHDTIGLLNAPSLQQQGLFDELRSRSLQATSQTPVSPVPLEKPAPVPTPEAVATNKPANNTLLNLTPGGGTEVLTEVKPTTPQSQLLGGEVAIAPPLNWADPTKPSDNRTQASPLKIAMEQYLTTNPPTSGTQKSGNVGVPTATASPSLTQGKGKGAEVLNIAPNVASGSEGVNSVPTVPVMSRSPQSVAEFNNPYQTNLSNVTPTVPEVEPGGGLAPAVPNPAVTNNNVEPLRFPNQYQGNSVNSSGFLRTSENQGFSPLQPSSSNVGIAPLVGNREAAQPQFIEPLSGSDARPGRYAGDREVNPPSNP